MARLVLIVEDDTSLREVMRDILTQHGLEVALAKDGEEALSALGRGRVPDLLIVDLVLPRFDGWNLLEVIENLAPIPVIVTSGLPDRHVARGKRASAFLQKPFDLKALVDEVDRLLEARPAARPAPRPG